MNSQDSNELNISSVENTVGVYILESVIEAEMIENLLIANGIPCMIQRSHSSGGLGKAISINQGWGQVRVFEHDEKQARRILSDWKNASAQPYEY